MVELMRTTALLSRAGRDGHQFALPLPEHGGMLLPMRAFEFADGLFVTASHPSAEHLVGARVTALNGRPIDEVLDTLEPLVPRDGPATVANFRPVFMSRLDVLRGLGLIGTESDGAADRGAEMAASGRCRSSRWLRRVPRLVGRPRRLPPAIGRRRPDLQRQELAESHTLYIRYSQVQRIPVEDLATIRARAAAPERGARRAGPAAEPRRRQPLVSRPALRAPGGGGRRARPAVRADRPHDLLRGIQPGIGDRAHHRCHLRRRPDGRRHQLLGRRQLRHGWRTGRCRCRSGSRPATGRRACRTTRA